MKDHTTSQRVLAMTLSIVLVMGVTPFNVLAAPYPAKNGGEIISFQPLKEDIIKQIVPLGTSVEELNLPNTLWATIRSWGSSYYKNSELHNDIDGNKGQPDEYEVSIPVIWHSKPEYDGEKNRDYLFTPVFSKDYILVGEIQIPAVIVIVDGSVLPESLVAEGGS